jgi:hypothetical protein
MIFNNATPITTIHSIIEAILIFEPVSSFSFLSITGYFNRLKKYKVTIATLVTMLGYALCSA